MNAAAGNDVVSPNDISIVSSRSGSVIAELDATVVSTYALGLFCQSADVAASIGNSLRAANASLYLTMTTNVTMKSISCAPGYQTSTPFTPSCPGGSLPRCEVAREAASTPGSGSSSSAGLAAGIAVAIVVAVAIVAAVIFVMLRRKRHMKEPGAIAADPLGRSNLAFTNPIYNEDMADHSDYDAPTFRNNSTGVYDELPVNRVINHSEGHYSLATPGGQYADPHQHENPYSLAGPEGPYSMLSGSEYMDLPKANLHDEAGYMDVAAFPGFNPHLESSSDGAATMPIAAHNEVGYMDIAALGSRVDDLPK